MAELRRVRKVGGSLTVTIPKDIGLAARDWVQIERVGDSVLLRKVVT